MDNEKNYYTMSDEEQDKLYPLSKEEKQKWQTWVPKGYKITNMQIYDAKERGIPIPIGNKEHDQEYLQFLEEHSLKSIEKNKVTDEENEEDDENEKDDEDKKEEEEKRKKKKKGFGKFILEWLEHFKRRKKIKNITDNENIVGISNDLKNSKTNNNIEKYDENKDLQEELEKRFDGRIDKTNDFEKINQEERIKKIEEELTEYINLIEKELEKEEENYLVKIVERKKMFIMPLITAMIAAMLLSGLNIEDKVTREKLEHQIVNKVLTYELNEHITHEEALQKVMEDIHLGDEYQLSDGQRFNTNSLGTGAVTKELGKEFNAENKFEGKYPITGFSIIRNSDNQMIAYIEDFYDQTRTDDLKTFVDDSLKDTNLDYDDIRVEFHFGRTALKTEERSRLGWIEDNNIVLNEDEIQKIIDKCATYNGNVENLSENYVNITTKDGEVKIPVKDVAGKYYSPGTIVTGTDGKQYEISSLIEEEQTKIIEETKENVDGKKLSFDIKDCNLLAGAPFALLAATEYLRKKKMNEEAKKNPYYKTIGKDEKEEFVETFHETKNKSGSIHEATIYPETEFNPQNEILKQAYYEMTGIQVEDSNQLMYLTHNGRFLILNKENATQTYDITEYLTRHLENGNSIGDGWDEEAYEYFEEFNSNRGRRGGR